MKKCGSGIFCLIGVVERAKAEVAHNGNAPIYTVSRLYPLFGGSFREKPSFMGDTS